MDWFALIAGRPMYGAAEMEGLRSACRSAARRHARDAGDVSKRLDDLEEWTAELALLNQTLLRLLLARRAFTKESFTAVLREIDFLDGVEDGKLSRPPAAEAEGGDVPPACKTPRIARRSRRGH